MTKFKRQRNVPSDCIICAMRPGLYLNQVNIYQATFYCYHSDPPVKPHFKTSKLFRSLTLVCNLLLVYGIINDINQIEEEFTIKQILIFLEIFFIMSTIIFNLIFLAKNKLKLVESHGLMSLLNNKIKFGVEVILPSKSAQMLHDVLLYLVILLCIEEAIVFCLSLILEDVDNKFFIRTCILEVVVVSNVALGVYCLQILVTYEKIFEECYKQMETFLEELPRHVSSDTFLDKLKKLQRLYMCLRRNFILNENFLQPEIVIIYSIDICLLMIGYGYFAVMSFQEEVVLLKFDVYVILKSSAVVLAFGALCYQSEKVATMSQDILSFLFRCPISKLSPLESAQIEMLITTLTLQKPQLKASDIFTIGTGLLASVSGTVLTYVLVALQFHVLWSK